MTHTKHYRGIDFSVDLNNWGECYLSVDLATKTLTATVVPPTDMTADQIRNLPTSVDCPFGTTEGFNALLRGEEPLACEWDRGFKTRHTEQWLRSELQNYRTNMFWRTLSDRVPKQYVNTTGHVQSSVGLVIVPGFLNWFLHHQTHSQEDLVAARLGRGQVVESHPRPFLYSIIERIYRSDPNSTEEPGKWEEILREVATYKGKKAKLNMAQRTMVTSFLRKQSDRWLWDGFHLAEVPEDILATDHAFDAFLAALTSFAHDHQQTIAWDEVDKLSEEIVKIEGHILVLRQNNNTSDQHQADQR